jgi:hypothetical protein
MGRSPGPPRLLFPSTDHGDDSFIIRWMSAVHHTGSSVNDRPYQCRHFRSIIDHRPSVERNHLLFGLTYLTRMVPRMPFRNHISHTRTSYMWKQHRRSKYSNSRFSFLLSLLRDTTNRQQSVIIGSQLILVDMVPNPKRNSTSPPVPTPSPFLRFLYYAETLTFHSCCLFFVTPTSQRANTT